jgi:hypothetical protein
VHRSDGAEAYYAASWPAVSHLSEAISADDPYACADPQRSPNGVPTAQKSHEKVCGGGNIPLRPGDRGTRSQHVPTSKDCLLFPTNEFPSECLLDYEGTPFVLAMHLQKNVQGPDAYAKCGFMARYSELSFAPRFARKYLSAHWF